MVRFSAALGGGGLVAPSCSRDVLGRWSVRPPAAGRVCRRARLWGSSSPPITYGTFYSSAGRHADEDVMSHQADHVMKVSGCLCVSAVITSAKINELLV